MARIDAGRAAEGCPPCRRLHLDGDLGDPIPASPGDEQRLEGVTEIVRREVVGEGTEQWITNCPKS